MTGPAVFVAIFAGIAALAVISTWLAGAPRAASSNEKRQKYLLWWLTRRDRVSREDD